MKMDPSEAAACLRHWYECKGCPLCQDVRDHYAREDEQNAELVKAIMDSFPDTSGTPAEKK